MSDEVTNSLGEVETNIPDPQAGPHEGDQPTPQPLGTEKEEG